MLNPNQKEALFNGAGLGSMWALIGVGNWAEVSSAASAFSFMAAGAVSVLVGLHFFWRKMVRPICYHFGWMRRPKRRNSDYDETGPGDL